MINLIYDKKFQTTKYQPTIRFNGIKLDSFFAPAEEGGVFCHDDTMASGAAQALKELGYTGGEVIIVGYGGSAAGAKLIEEGYMVASAVQPLVEEGRGCIKALVKALNGEELNGWYKDVIVPLDADTLKTYDKSLLW